MNDQDPFRWREEGESGIRVEANSGSIISHEVMYEDDFNHIKERPLFMGASIPLKRFAWVGIMIGLLVVLLFSRAFWMQVVRGSSYRELAERNRLRTEVVLSRRGIIRDRTGAVLAENIPSFDVRAVERLLPTDEKAREELLAKVGRIVGSNVSDIESIFASSTDPDESVVLKRDVPYDRALSVKIMSVDAPAIEVAVGSKRRYSVSTEVISLGHILGYISGITREELEKKRELGYRQIDLIGKTGIEAAYEAQLRGEPGEKLYEVDSRHRITAIVGENEPVDGQDLYLTLDLELQKAADKALREGMARAKVNRGSAIAIDPRDGSILAIVSLPAYDNNIFTGSVSSTLYRALIQNPDHPLLPRAWAGTYPSGSTAKPVIATAALAENVITPKTTVLSVGGLNVGPWFFPDWKAGGHGVVNVRSAIAWSVNTFFYYIGGGYDRFVGLGVDRLTDWMRRFGLGEKTGLDVPGEALGFVPSKEWKQKTKNEGWFVGDTYNLSIGQGDLLVTPLQVAAFTATIANGGFKITPHLGLKYGRPDETPVILPIKKADEKIASSEAIEAVRLGMRDTVVYGSGRSLADLPIAVAGKTGTAQWRSDKANHAWFTAFAPFVNPEIVVTVLLEEGEEGSRTAAPVAKEILRAWNAGRK